MVLPLAPRSAIAACGALVLLSLLRATVAQDTCGAAETSSASRTPCALLQSASHVQTERQLLTEGPIPTEDSPATGGTDGVGVGANTSPATGGTDGVDGETATNSSWTSLQGAAGSVKAAVVNTASAVKNTTLQAGQDIADFANSTWAGIKSAVGISAGAPDSTGAQLRNASSSGAVNETDLEAIWDAIDNLTKSVGSAASKAWNATTSMLTNPVRAAKGDVVTSTTCFTQDTGIGESWYTHVATEGSPCTFGVDKRDEGFHCIAQGGAYGANGWCWTTAAATHWGRCADGCPLAGPDKAIATEIEKLQEQIADLKESVERSAEQSGNQAVQQSVERPGEQSGNQSGEQSVKST
eukprot:gb/GFBE01046523.1/.p1 GENE.gb/GFBE01046523.1/~~gb/GFBE01046523.1/.p1  ORF type:complete len:354 (+),score=55.51 gb/GFBE01046523.1/:1-1062(+)